MSRNLEFVHTSIVHCHHGTPDVRLARHCHNNDVRPDRERTNVFTEIIAGRWSGVYEQRSAAGEPEVDQAVDDHQRDF